MPSRVALRGSYRQHSPKAIKVGRPSMNERLEVTLVLRRKRRRGRVAQRVEEGADVVGVAHSSPPPVRRGIEQKAIGRNRGRRERPNDAVRNPGRPQQ